MGWVEQLKILPQPPSRNYFGGPPGTGGASAEWSMGLRWTFYLKLQNLAFSKRPYINNLGAKAFIFKISGVLKY